MPSRFGDGMRLRFFKPPLTSDLVHSLQHLSFLLSALLFWWALLHGRQAQIGYGMAVLYVFSTGVHSSILGALLTFSPRVWYPIYAGSTASVGIDCAGRPADRWLDHVGSGRTRFPGAGLALFAKWIQQPARVAVICLSVDLVCCTPDLQFKSSYREALAATGGDSHRGQAAIERYGCGTCHTIPGIRGAEGLVGPPLTKMALRTYIAGVLTNTPDNMERWIKDPPAVDHQTAMPKLGVADSRCAGHCRVSLHAALTDLELLFCFLGLLSGVGEIQQRRRNDCRRHCHKNHHRIYGLLDHCHA